MGLAARTLLITIVATFLLPQAAALQGELPALAADGEPVPVPVDAERLLGQAIGAADEATRAPCAGLRVVPPADQDLGADPYVGEHATGVALNMGPAGQLLVVMTYPGSCATWVQERVGGSPQEVEDLIEILLP